MISKRIDRLVEWTKWPAAFLAVFSLPLTIYAWGRLFYVQVPLYPGFFTMFALGIALFVLFMRTSIARTSFARRVIELERDLTQSVLALATMHPLIGYGESRAKGSRVRWLGRGNWILLAAPYFVPTATILLWLFSLILFQSLRSLVLGIGVAYHVVAVAVQCYLGTSELRRLGRKFCWMFLLPANMAVAGLVTAYALNGFTGMSHFLYDWAEIPKTGMSWFWQWMVSGTTKAI